MAIATARDWFDAISARRYADVKDSLQRFAGTDDGGGETGLMLAARTNDVEMARILGPVESGRTNSDHWTALLIAAARDRALVCGVLAPLERDIIPPDGRTALMVAAEAGHKDTVSVLCEYYGTERDTTGRSALDYAALKGRHDVVRLLTTRLRSLTIDDVARAIELAIEAGQQEDATFLTVIREGLQKGIRFCDTCITQLGIIEQLRAENEALKVQTRQADEKAARQQAEVRKLTGILAQLDTDVGTIKHKYDELKREHDAICGEIEPLRSRVATYEQENLELRAESLSLTQELNQTRVERDQFTGHSGKPAPELEEEIAKLRVYLTRAEEDIRAYKVTLDEMAETRSKLRESEKELLETITEKNSLLTQTDLHIQRLEATNRLLTEDLSTAREEVAQLAGQLETIQEDATNRIEALLAAPPELGASFTTNLMTAASEGDFAKAQSLLSQARMSNSDGFTALMFAAENNHTDIIRLLLRYEGGMINHFGETALMIAADCAHLDAVSLLAEREAGIKRPDGATALEIAIMHGHFDVAEALTPIEGIPLKSVDTTNRRRTELMQAIEDGSVILAWCLAASQAGLVDEEGQTALMLAAQRGCLEIARFLMRREVGMTTPWGSTALMWAAQCGHSGLVELLLDAEGRFQKNDGGTALMYAAKSGHVECAKLLLEKEGGMQNAVGWTALMFACTSNHPECAELLLDVEGGMASNTTDANGAGFTALMAAAQSGSVACARVALKVEAGMRQVDNSTALMWAARGDHAAVVKLLLKQEGGLTTNHRNPMGQGATALMMAAAEGHHASVQLLLPQEGHLRTSTGKTALDFAKTSEIWNLLRASME